MPRVLGHKLDIHAVPLVLPMPAVASIDGRMQPQLFGRVAGTATVWVCAGTVVMVCGLWLQCVHAKVLAVRDVFLLV